MPLLSILETCVPAEEESAGDGHNIGSISPTKIAFITY